MSNVPGIRPISGAKGAFLLFLTLWAAGQEAVSAAEFDQCLRQICPSLPQCLELCQDQDAPSSFLLAKFLGKSFYPCLPGSPAKGKPLPKVPPLKAPLWEEPPKPEAGIKGTPAKSGAPAWEEVPGKLGVPANPKLKVPAWAEVPGKAGVPAKTMPATVVGPETIKQVPGKAKPKIPEGKDIPKAASPDIKKTPDVPKGKQSSSGQPKDLDKDSKVAKKTPKMPVGAKPLSKGSPDPKKKPQNSGEQVSDMPDPSKKNSKNPAGTKGNPDAPLEMKKAPDFLPGGTKTPEVPEGAKKIIEISAEGKISHEFPGGVKKQPDIPVDAKKKPDIPGDTTEAPGILPGSEKNPEVPGETKKATDIASGAKKNPDINGKSKLMPDVPPGAKKNPEVPDGSKKAPNAPPGAKKISKAPKTIPDGYNKKAASTLSPKKPKPTELPIPPSKKQPFQSPKSPQKKAPNPEKNKGSPEPGPRPKGKGSHPNLEGGKGITTPMLGANKDPLLGNEKNPGSEERRVPGESAEKEMPELLKEGAKDDKAKLIGHNLAKIASAAMKLGQYLVKDKGDKELAVGGPGWRQGNGQDQLRGSLNKNRKRRRGATKEGAKNRGESLGRTHSENTISAEPEDHTDNRPEADGRKADWDEKDMEQRLGDLGGRRNRGRRVQGSSMKRKRPKWRSEERYERLISKEEIGIGRPKEEGTREVESSRTRRRRRRRRRGRRRKKKNGRPLTRVDIQM